MNMEYRNGKRNILGGVLLILIAVALVMNGLGLLPFLKGISVFKLLGTILFAYGCLDSFRHRHFVGGLLSLSIVAWIWEHELGIANITPFPLCLAAILVGLGLNMMFKGEKIVSFSYKDGDEWRSGSYDEMKEHMQREEWVDGRHIVLENNFNSTSKYVNSDAFNSANFENNFGSANIYFTNAVMANNEAFIKVENNFGTTTLYFPRSWRLHTREDVTFGALQVMGEANRDMDAPLVNVDVESNFGTVRIFFE